MAPPVKSALLKRLHNTERADRRRPKPDVATRLVVPPRPPRHLSKAVAAEWRRVMPVLAGLGAITAADLFMVELLCGTLATARAAAASLEAEGSSTGTAANGIKGHPSARVLSTARAQAARLLAELGLTPRGRAMLDLRPPFPLLIDDDDGPPALSLTDFLASNPDIVATRRR
jgi:P27 family predicted phage terminase small subunit